MNERIKELLDWAKDHARIYVIECELANIPVVQEEYDRRFQEKFAELIVRECADLNFRGTGFVTSEGEDMVRSMIKQHFGVEE